MEACLSARLWWLGRWPRENARMRHFLAGKPARKEITMNTKMLLTMAVFLTSALSPVARGGSLSTEVIGMFPRDTGEFAYADLRQARTLTWFPQLQKQVLPDSLRQFEQLLASAGVDPNSQVEELAWALMPVGLPSGAGLQHPRSHERGSRGRRTRPVSDGSGRSLFQS